MELHCANRILYLVLTDTAHSCLLSHEQLQVHCRLLWSSCFLHQHYGPSLCCHHILISDIILMKPILYSVLVQINLTDNSFMYSASPLCFKGLLKVYRDCLPGPASVFKLRVKMFFCSKKKKV